MGDLEFPNYRRIQGLQQQLPQQNLNKQIIVVCSNSIPIRLKYQIVISAMWEIKSTEWKHIIADCDNFKGIKLLNLIKLHFHVPQN